MSKPVDHRALAAHYFNASWQLIDLAHQTPEQDRDMLATAAASRQHWIDAGGSPENLAVADWQVAHAASLAGLGDTAMAFARAAVERADNAELPTWLRASAHEGLARAHACLGDRVGFEQEAKRARDLLEAVADPDARDLVAIQLASIPTPQ
jgi:hypothetical protein